jgi:hypothetical protein
MPSCGFFVCDWPKTPAEKRAARRRPVNQGKGRGVTKPPVRKRRKR